MKIRETTPNVVRAQARKQQRAAERRAELKKEAEELGIPVFELQLRKWQQVQEIRERMQETREREQRRMESPPSYYSQRSVFW